MIPRLRKHLPALNLPWRRVGTTVLFPLASQTYGPLLLDRHAMSIETYYVPAYWVGALSWSAN